MLILALDWMLDREVREMECNGDFRFSEFWGRCYIPLSPGRRNETNGSLRFKFGGRNSVEVV